MFFQPMIPVIALGTLILGAAIVFSLKVKSRQSRFHWTLRAFAALLLITAGFRPSAQVLSVSESYNNRYNVYFVVDLTSSMVAEDWDGGATRLEGVREDINDLLDDYVGSKFSLITFNSKATMRVPLTPDSTALASSINTMLPEVTQYSNGSSISAPKKLLEETLQAEAKLDPKGERANIVLYFGDGEQTSATKPDSFSSVKNLVSAAKVYGYGTPEGGKMKTQTGLYISSDKDSYIKDTSGKDGLSVIDENNLKAIANDLGGTYEHRASDKRISEATLNDSQKVELEKKEGANINNTVEYYWLALTPFMLIMFIEAGYLGRKAKKLGVRFK